MTQQKAKEPLSEQRKNKERTIKEQKKQNSGVKELTMSVYTESFFISLQKYSYIDQCDNQHMFLFKKLKNCI